MIDDMSDEELKSICKRKNIKNAFSDVYFGARNSSIYDCTPPEPLHQFLLGTVKYLVREFFDVISTGSRKVLSHSVEYLYKNCRRQSSRDYPSLACVQNSIEKPGVLSASEQYSRLFALFIACNIPEIMKTITTRKRGSVGTNPITGGTFLMGVIDPISKEDFLQWVSLFEDTLIMYQWLMSPTHKKEDFQRTTAGNDLDGESNAQKRIRTFMWQYFEMLRLREGNGLRINKYHQMLHYERQILKDGSIQNIDTGRPESNAVTMYKKLAANTQLRQKTLIHQVSQRHYEDTLLDEAVRLSSMGKQKDLEICEMNKKFDHSSKYELRLTSLDENGEGIQEAELTLKWDSKHTIASFESNVMIALCKRLFFSPVPHYGCVSHESFVRGFTEYIHPESKEKFRAHPNYRRQGSWYDWCTIKWEGIADPIPAKIVTFLDLRESVMMSFDEIIEMNDRDEDRNNRVDRGQEKYLSKDKWVLIQSANTLDESNAINNNDADFASHHFDSKIFDSFVLEKKYRLVPIETIHSSCYCIPQYQSERLDGTHERIMFFKNIKEWGDIFIRDNIY